MNKIKKIPLQIIDNDINLDINPEYEKKKYENNKKNNRNCCFLNLI